MAAHKVALHPRRRLLSLEFFFFLCVDNCRLYENLKHSEEENNNNKLGWPRLRIFRDSPSRVVVPLCLRKLSEQQTTWPNADGLSPPPFCQLIPFLN